MKYEAEYNGKCEIKGFLMAENVKLSPVYGADYVKSVIFAHVINKLIYG